MKRRRFKSNLRLLTHHPLVFAGKYRWPLAVLLAGSVLDVLTTWEVLRLFGMQVELHPAAKIFGRIFGASLPVIAIGKVIQAAVAIFVASLWRKWTGWLLILCGVLYTLAAISNHFRLL